MNAIRLAAAIAAAVVAASAAPSKRAGSAFPPDYSAAPIPAGTQFFA